MEASDIVIVNLTPFRGASADAGTLVELGWFLGRGRQIFGYSNAALPFAARSRRQIEAVADPLPGLAVEEFGLSDNLMVAGALLGSHPLVVADDGRSGHSTHSTCSSTASRWLRPVLAGRAGRLNGDGRAPAYIE